MQPQPTIVELNMDDIQVEMDRTAPQVSGSSVRSQQRTTNHFCPRAMDNLWTHLSDLERLLDSEQVGFLVRLLFNIICLVVYILNFYYFLNYTIKCFIIA